MDAEVRDCREGGTAAYTAGSGTSRLGVLARHKVAFVLLGLFALLLGVVAAGAAYLNQQVRSIPRLDLDLSKSLGGYQRPPVPAGSASDAVNILVAGIDSGGSSRIVEEVARGRWEPGSHRSDTIMVVHLDADRRNAYVIPVSRDTWVPVDGYGMSKINAAFSYGGPRLFVRTMEQFTGLRMDHLVVVDWGDSRASRTLSVVCKSQPPSPGGRRDSTVNRRLPTSASVTASPAATSTASNVSRTSCVPWRQSWSPQAHSRTPCGSARSSGRSPKMSPLTAASATRG